MRVPQAGSCMLESLLTFALSASFGIHAFYYHRREGFKAVSARRWMFGLYAAGFLVASMINYVEFLLLVLLDVPHQHPIQLIYTNAILFISYGVVLAGSRRKSR